MTNEEIEELLANELENAVLIGTPDERKNYYPAIVGYDTNYQRVIYDRDKLVSCFISSQNMAEQEAQDWISFNIDTTLSENTNLPILITLLN